MTERKCTFCGDDIQPFMMTPAMAELAAKHIMVELNYFVDMGHPLKLDRVTDLIMQVGQTCTNETIQLPVGTKQYRIKYRWGEIE